MKISEIFVDKYLKAPDIGSRTVVWKIDNLEMADMSDGEKKPIVYFDGKPKGLVLNKTNANVIADEFGDDTTTWLGKELELFTTPVTFQGQTRPAIRVRIPSPPEFADDVPQ